MLDYKVTAHRLDSNGSEATTKQALIVLDTDMAAPMRSIQQSCCWPVWPPAS